MSKRLVVSIIVFSIVFLFFILKLLKNRNVSIKYSLVWIIPLCIFLIASLFPNVIYKLAIFLGFETMVSFIFSVLFAFLLFICLMLTIIVTRLRERQKTLIQELSLLKSKKR